ncbi:MAG: cob(I)yrinic acid a,c-diamide adenosyltransferase [Candidatus Micrarchaeia archaeon]|jgi:cob(I)alamin adenosyltransferase
MAKKTFVLLWTGNGGGKTTNALGLALRAAGHGMKTIFVQFMKGRKSIGEYKAQKFFKGLFKVKQFGSPHFMNLLKPSDADKARAQKGMDYAFKALDAEKPDFLVLDEVNIAAAIGLVDKGEVLRLIKKAKGKCTGVVLTGRNAPKEFIDSADYATSIGSMFRPMPPQAVKGIEY